MQNLTNLTVQPRRAQSSCSKRNSQIPVCSSKKKRSALLKLPCNFKQMWLTSAKDQIGLHSMKPGTHDLSPSRMLKPHAPQKSFTLYTQHKLMQANRDFLNKSEKWNCILPLQWTFSKWRNALDGFSHASDQTFLTLSMPSPRGSDTKIKYAKQTTR
jgi:hypothetical protein